MKFNPWFEGKSRNGTLIRASDLKQCDGGHQTTGELRYLPDWTRVCFACYLVRKEADASLPSWSELMVVAND